MTIVLKFQIMEGAPAAKKAKLKIDYGTQVVTLQEVEVSEVSNVFDIEQDIEEVLEDEEVVDDGGEGNEADHEMDEGIEFEEEITYSMKLPDNTEEKFQKFEGPGNKIILCRSDETVETVKNSWTRAMTCVLIEEYRKMKLDFQDPNKKQKDLWIKLAENMCHRGCDVTWDMCDQKWRNLKHTFKSIYSNIHRSEKSKRRWDFYESLLDIFKPILEVQNLRKGRLQSPPHSQDEDSNSRTSDTSKKQKVKQTASYTHVIYNDNGVSDSSNVYQIPSSSRNNSDVDCTIMENGSETPPLWFQEFLKQYRADESCRLDLIKEMHAEFLQVERRKCAALEALLKKLTE